MAKRVSLVRTLAFAFLSSLILFGSAEAADITCKEIFENNDSLTDGVYELTIDGQNFNAYCERDTFDGGWTLFATTDSTHCAESLIMGSNTLTDLDTVYLTNKLGEMYHDQWMMELFDNGSSFIRCIYLYMKYLVY